jgi:hypothetical protein
MSITKADMCHARRSGEASSATTNPEFPEEKFNRMKLLERLLGLFKLPFLVEQSHLEISIRVFFMIRGDR